MPRSFSQWKLLGSLPGHPPYSRSREQCPIHPRASRRCPSSSSVTAAAHIRPARRVCPAGPRRKTLTKSLLSKEAPPTKLPMRDPPTIRGGETDLLRRKQAFCERMDPLEPGEWAAFVCVCLFGVILQAPLIVVNNVEVQTNERNILIKGLSSAPL